MATPVKLAISGDIVPLRSNNRRLVIRGTAYIDAGTIVAVRPKAAAAPSGFDEADVARIDCGRSWIFPGLIDLHSHLGYNALPLWTHQEQADPFLHHGIWPGRKSYGPMVSWPAWAMAKAAPESLLSYVQIRALAGGTTSIQGWPASNRRPANQLVRNADDQAFEDVPDPILTSTLTLDTAELTERARRLALGRGFIYHCAEGLDTSIVTREFDDLADTGCLREGLIAIHLTAVQAEDFSRWNALARLQGDEGPGSVVWSPFSNLWLYGQTTKIPDAVANGVNVCLGTDWGPSGTKNLLGELKVARLVAQTNHWNLDDLDLVEMVTANPGDALARFWKRPVGRLIGEALADITVVRRRDKDPFKSLVEAVEEDVELVLVGGVAEYGTKALMIAAGRKRMTAVTIGTQRRRVVLTEPADRKLPEEERRVWYFSRALKRLEEVRADPAAAVAAPEATTGVDARGTLVSDSLNLILDMPGGLGVTAGPPPDGQSIDFSDLPIPSLRHDRTWLRSLRRRGFHAGLLNRLDEFFD